MVSSIPFFFFGESILEESFANPYVLFFLRVFVAQLLLLLFFFIEIEFGLKFW